MCRDHQFRQRNKTAKKEVEVEVGGGDKKKQVDNIGGRGFVGLDGALHKIGS